MKSVAILFSEAEEHVCDSAHLGAIFDSLPHWRGVPQELSAGSFLCYVVHIVFTDKSVFTTDW